jgi:hypothetical protein
MEKCPEGFRCGPCVAADKVNAESAGERDLYSARQEMLLQKIAAKRAYEAKANARLGAAVQAGEQAVRETFDSLASGIAAHVTRRYTREEVLLVAGAGIADGAAGVSRTLATLDGLR